MTTALSAGVFTYRDLDVWRQSMDLVEKVYLLTAAFPEAERYALASQLRRASVSIPSNIAEGRCRGTTPAFHNHVCIALGSHGELETGLEIASRLGFITSGQRRDLDDLTAAVGRMLNGLRRRLDLKCKGGRRVRRQRVANP